MDRTQIANLIDQAAGQLKNTTMGYMDKPESYWNSHTTTNWYKGLQGLKKASAELRKPIVAIIAFKSNTTQITFRIQVS